MQENIIAKICSLIDEMQPMIEEHGGNIEFVDYKDRVVYVRLLGACTHCPFSLYTIKLGIEERLKTVISEINYVETV